MLTYVKELFRYSTDRAELTASYYIPAHHNIKGFSQNAIPDQPGLISARNRGIVLFGATVRAINIAIHIAAEGKNMWSDESNFRVDNEAQGIQIKGGDVIVLN